MESKLENLHAVTDEMLGGMKLPPFRRMKTPAAPIGAAG